MTGLTLDEILSNGSGKPAAALTDKEVLDHPLVQKLLNQVRWDTAEKDSAFFVGCLLQGIEALFNGNLLASGQAMDDAITHYLSDYEARLGKENTIVAASALIANISLFLPPAKQAAIKKALEAK